MEGCEQLDVTVQSVSCLRAQKVLMSGVRGNLSALIQRRVTALMILIRGEDPSAVRREREAGSNRTKASEELQGDEGLGHLLALLSTGIWVQGGLALHGCF